jgi:hypothetical protein
MNEAAETQETQELGTIEMSAQTMLGDLVGLVIDELKAAPDVWQKLSERKQDEVIDRVRRRCEDAIQQAVHFIYSEGRTVITADLEQLTAKDGIKAVLTLNRHDENRHELLDSVGKPVLVIVGDARVFGGGALPKPDPMQPQLPIADAMNPAD